MWSSMRVQLRAGFALLGVVSLVGAAACSVAAPPTGEAPAGAKPLNFVVQAGQLQPTAPDTPLSGWDTEWSKKFGISLVASYDASGPNAWNPAQHPLVYVTSEGPGYSGLLSSTVTLPGLAIFDADTYQPIATAQYALGSQRGLFEPHGSGVSPDGRWLFIPTGMSEGFGDVGAGRLLIIDARTLKLTKVLATPGNVHHIKSFRDGSGRPLVLVEDFADSTFFVLDPDDDHRVVGGVGPGEIRGNGYLAFAQPDGKAIWVTVRTGFGSDGGVAIVDTENWKLQRRIPIPDSSPIWVAFTNDGKLAYVSGGHDSIVAKVDVEKGVVLSTARAGTEGPYGVNLSWDEKLLVAIGKGEGSHNRGKSVGLINPQVMGRPVDTVNTDCIRGDHALLHPNPARNELWISCNSSFETVVFDLAKQQVKARLPQPNGGSTHNGAFVRYAPDWAGEVLSDQNGLHGTARQAQTMLLAEASATR